MTVLQLSPTVLSVLVFCAHCFRGGLVLLIPPLLLSLGLLIYRSGAVARFFQLLLLAIAGVWIFTALQIGMRRMEAGEPWLRMALILVGVALFALFAAALWESDTLLRRYPRTLLSPGPSERSGGA
jgi:uncharacterized membrane protein